VAVNYTPVAPGDERDANQVNDIYDAFATDSNSVGSINFAEEGIDHRPLEDHPVGQRTGRVREGTRNAASLPVALGFVQFVQNGTAFRLNAPGGVPASLGNGELLRVRSRTWLESTFNSGNGLGGGAPSIFSQHLSWNDGFSVFKIPFSGRSAIRGQAGGVNVDRDCVMWLEGWLTGPIANIAWVELQYAFAGGGVAFPSASMLWATLFRRQNEV
jgi:hypothetical protein